jgi:hypothetical protein
MLDHVIPLHERHLLRLGHEYISYYHEDRTHIGLSKKTPATACSSPIPLQRLMCWHYLEYAAYTIGTLGRQPREDEWP